MLLISDRRKTSPVVWDGRRQFGKTGRVTIFPKRPRFRIAMIGNHWRHVETPILLDHFTCTSANVIYCITCTYCNKLYIGETGRRLGDRFREHLRDVERNDKDASKPVARHFNLPNHSKQHMAVCGLSLHLGSSESRKTLEQKFIFQIGTLNPHGINERFSFN